ncbi:MAG: hypothetical protein ABR510_00190 [Trueperaceae bacterium]
MIRTAPEPQRTIVGTFLVLAAVVMAVAPMAVSLRSAGIALLAYLAFSIGGMPFAYLAALLGPALGLVASDVDWLVMLPIVLSGNLLAMIGLEYAWRWWAVVVSPILLVVPAAFVQSMAQRELFRVELPWDDARGAWLGLHLLVGVFGVLVAILIERGRTRTDGVPTARSGRLTDAERAQRVAPPKRTAARSTGPARRG